VSKYKAVNAERLINGVHYKFDSNAEARYFDALYLLLSRGNIKELKTQPRYTIATAYKINATGTKSGKRKIGNLSYTPDFEYIRDGRKVAVEVKGVKTADYRLRLKLFLACAWKEHGVSEFIEITKSGTEVYDCTTVKEVK